MERCARAVTAAWRKRRAAEAVPAPPVPTARKTAVATPATAAAPTAGTNQRARGQACRRRAVVRAEKAARTRSRATASGGSESGKSSRTRISSDIEGLLRVASGGKRRLRIADTRPHARACPREAGPHRADRNVERLGDLVVCEVGHREQEQGLALVARQAAESRHDVCLDEIVRSRRHAIRRSGVGLEPPALCPPVPPEQIRGDSEQPLPRIRSAQVEGPPLVEGPGEGLGGDLLVHVFTD